MIIGLGMAGEYTASATYVIESWPERRRNLASGLLLSGYPLGSVLAAKTYAWVVPSSSWRVLFFIGIVPVAVALYLRRALPEAREWADTAEPRVSATRVLFTGSRATWNIPVAVIIAVSLFFVLRTLPMPVTLALIAVIVAGFVILGVQFAGNWWPVTIALMVTVFAAFLYSWPLQSLLPTYLKTSLHYSPAQVSDALLYGGSGMRPGRC
jgi:MFS transporter, SHS family, sialic acid transporter